MQDLKMHILRLEELGFYHIATMIEEGNTTKEDFIGYEANLAKAKRETTIEEFPLHERGEVLEILIALYEYTSYNKEEK